MPNWLSTLSGTIWWPHRSVTSRLSLNAIVAVRRGRVWGANIFGRAADRAVAPSASLELARVLRRRGAALQSTLTCLAVRYSHPCLLPAKKNSKIEIGADIDSHSGPVREFSASVSCIPIVDLTIL